MSLRRLAIFPTKAVAASARQTLHGGTAVGYHRLYDPLGCQRRFNSDKKLPGCLGGVGGDIPPIASPPPSKAEGPTATLPTAQHYTNTNKVIAVVSEAAVGPELASDIATNLMFSGPLERVRFAAKVLRGADYLQLRKELYLEQVVAFLSDIATKDIVPPPDFQKEVVSCVHTGQLMWDRLGAYTVLRLEQKGIISLGHKGIINAARDYRIDDELLALANTLNDVTSLDISRNESITTCEPFAGTLVELNAEGSGMTDEGLKLCSRLRKLKLSATKGVTSCAPFADTLEELQLGYGSGITDASLKCCRKIRKLSITGNCDVTTCEPFADTLEELHVDRYTGITDASLKCCRKIRKLSITDTPHVTTFSPFANTLEELHVGKVHELWHHYGYFSLGITDASLKCCRKIRKLSITGNCDVTTCAPFAETLEELDVRGYCGLTSDAIQGCTKLRKLDMDLDYNMKMELTPCDSLKNLEELTPSDGFTEASLLKVAEHCHRLKRLNLNGCPDGVKGVVLEKFAVNCRELQYLDVTCSRNITDSSIIAFVKNCPQLRCLVARWAKALTNKAITQVAENCPNLEELDVSMTSKITNVSIKEVAKKCPKLRKLNVFGTKGRITNASMLEIAKNCPNLEELNVSWTTKITDASIKIVAAKCPKLRELNVGGTKGRITHESVMEIAKNCRVIGL